VSVAGPATNTADAIFTFQDPQATPAGCFQRLDGSRWRMDSAAGAFTAWATARQPYHSVPSTAAAQPPRHGEQLGAPDVQSVIPPDLSTNLPVYRLSPS
jgi:hypothetical protein